MLNQIHKEKEEERVIVDIWCHFGHAYITKVDEGKKILCFLSIVVAIDISLSVFRRNFNSKDYLYSETKRAIASLCNARLYTAGKTCLPFMLAMGMNHEFI